MEHKFIKWAIDRAQTVQQDVTEYDGEKYQETIRVFKGRMHPGRVRTLKKEIGNVPVSTEFRQVVCQFGGNYRSEAGRVIVSETVFTKI